MLSTVLEYEYSSRHEIMSLKRRKPDVAPQSSLSSSSPYVLHSLYKAIYARYKVLNAHDQRSASTL